MERWTRDASSHKAFLRSLLQTSPKIWRFSSDKVLFLFFVVCLFYEWPQNYHKRNWYPVRWICRIVYLSGKGWIKVIALFRFHGELWLVHEPDSDTLKVQGVQFRSTWWLQRKICFTSFKISISVECVTERLLMLQCLHVRASVFVWFFLFDLVFCFCFLRFPAAVAKLCKVYREQLRLPCVFKRWGLAKKTPTHRHKWNPAIARLRILRDFIITMRITSGLYVWDGHLIWRKRVRDTQGPVSNHPVSTAATYSSSSSAQTFSICPCYGFSREDVGRKCSFITTFHSCTLTCRLLRPLTGISQ